ncbi:MAG: sensor histidine kinase [Bacteroidota bacterium]
MKFTSFIQRYKLYHFLFWLALLGGWYFFRYDDFRDKPLAFTITLLKVADLVLMVYITNYFLIPQLLYKKKYLVFGCVFLGFVFLSSWIKMYFEGQLMENPRAFSLSHNLKGRIYDNIIPHLLLVSTGAAFKLLIDYARAQRRIGEMAKENAEAELNFLKSQINPHFVFNSLNSVYFLIDKQNIEARDALHKFSDMLRYQLYECNGDTTSIEKELVYLHDYIDLQKLRRNENCMVNFSQAGNLAGFSIAPLLLIPFIENAFKHLSHYRDKKDSIEIHIEKKNDLFVFSVSNSTEPGKKQAELVIHGGIGLKNVQRRLELLYPGKHKLVIKPGSNTFTIHLEIETV